MYAIFLTWRETFQIHLMNNIRIREMSFTISSQYRCQLRFYFQLFVGGRISYLHYFCLCSYIGVQHILCCIFVFVFLRLVYPKLSVPLDCPFVIIYNICSCLRIVISKTQCVLFLFYFVFLYLMYPMLAVSLDCPFYPPHSTRVGGYIGILMSVRPSVTLFVSG